MLKKFFKWIFKDELIQLKNQIESSKLVDDKCFKTTQVCERLLSNFDVSVDVGVSNYHSSWAVISLQGYKSDYVKFVDLSNYDIHEIMLFVNRFESINSKRIKVDSAPRIREVIKFYK